jgi:hypothetical protein
MCTCTRSSLGRHTGPIAGSELCMGNVV